MTPTDPPGRGGDESPRRERRAGGPATSRRTLLRVGGAAAATGLAGCSLPNGADETAAQLQSCPIDVDESAEEYRTHPNENVRMWRGGLRRLGYYPDETVPDSVSVNWTFPINYKGHTAAKASPVPTPDQETIVFAGDSGWVEAYTPDGRKRWSTPTDATHLGFHGSAAIVGDVAYIGGYDGDVYAIDIGTGDLIWHVESRDLDGTLAVGSSPAYYDGLLYVVVEYGSPSTGALWVLDAETGEKVHVAETPDGTLENRMWGQAHPSATIDLEEGRLLTGSNDGAVYCWEFPCLEFAWKYQAGPEGGPTGERKAGGEFNLGAEVKGTAPTFDGRTYVGSWDDHVHCLDIADGEEVWSFETGGIVMSNPAADPDEGVVYAGSGDHNIYALDAESGEELWSTDVNGTIIGSVTVTQDTVMVGSYDTHLYALDKETGERRWRVGGRGHVTSAAVPIDGRIYYAERGDISGYYDDDAEETLHEPGHAYCLVGDE